MSFLLRVVLPDRPGMLGAVATAIGQAGGDIVSLDVVERGPGGAVDDLLVVVPPGGLADRLISSAQSVPGVVVESLRPYLGGTDLHRDLELVDALAADPGRRAGAAGANAPPGCSAPAGRSLAASSGGTGRVTVAASPGAPDLAGLDLRGCRSTAARRMTPEERGCPERWEVLGTELAAAPVGRPNRAVLVGRPGRPALPRLRGAAAGPPGRHRRHRRRAG